jgi:hypothetical protein
MDLRQRAVGTALLAIAVSAVEAAVRCDTGNRSSYAVTTSTAPPVVITWPHTINASLPEQVLVVGLATGEWTTLADPTTARFVDSAGRVYDLTLIRKSAVFATDRYLHLYCARLRSVAGGAGTVRFVFTGAQNGGPTNQRVIGGAVALCNASGVVAACAWTNPAGVDPIYTALTTAIPGAMLVDVVSMKGADLSWTPVKGALDPAHIELWDLATGNNQAMAGGCMAVSAAGTVTPGWDCSQAVSAQTTIAAAFAPAVSGTVLLVR